VKRYLLGIGCLAIITGLAAVIGADSRVQLQAEESQAQSVNVTIDNFSFNPKDLTVSKGTTVTWINRDDVPHTIVSTEQKFRSKALDTGDRFSFTFNDSGTYAYFCSVHPMMTGRVLVK
jgi:plastocyanin